HDAEDDWNYVLKRLATNRIMPGKIISHKFSLENLMQGFHIMRDKTEDYGKIMCVMKKNKKF
ncbi:MAG: galactitol-1-phosphate 5-dehydrogenase, partial [Lachnospiraceae bacterium]|nr:galactitol-1-phosphate 5-dehydrogenase [Lachnospiraceae bacterium]